MIITALRTVLMYVFVVLTLRVMGKRQIGELEASELVVTIIVSEIAAMPITNLGVPMSGSILAILILLILEVLLSHLAYRKVWFRSLLYGKPSTFFEKGKLNQAEMEKQRFNVADLMEEIRNSGAVSLDQVDYVIMETNGNVSVITRADSSPLTPAHLHLSPDPVRMSYVIIDNGDLIRSNMKRLGLNDRWLEQQLQENHLRSVRQVFYLSFEQNTGKTVLIPKQRADGAAGRNGRKTK